MRLLKVGQVFVVSNHSHRMARSLEIVFLFGESMDDGKEFLVENITVTFCSQKDFGKKGIGV